jgi:hypothetical protein
MKMKKEMEVEVDEEEDKKSGQQVKDAMKREEKGRTSLDFTNVDA